MLKQRVITAFVLLFLILAVVFVLPAIWFDLFIALVLGIAVWEWSKMTGLTGLPARTAFLVVAVVLFAVLTHSPLSLTLALSVGALFWIGALILVCLYPQGKIAWANKPVLFLITLPLFFPGWLSFVYLRDQQYFAFHVLLMMGLVAAADIGAYFAGKAFGRHKLAPRVSPNKTWEGFVGGLLACCLLVLVAGLVFIMQVVQLNGMHWIKLFLSAILIAATSVTGDLFESMVKRYRDIKDSGTILPGHGGMLDRIDGLTAAAPVYALLLVFMQQDFL